MSASALAPVFHALGDETRWEILTVLGEGAASASTLADRLPISRQAIAKHLEILQSVGLVESRRVGRQVQFQVVGAELSAAARTLEAIGDRWQQRLERIKGVAEEL